MPEPMPRLKPAHVADALSDEMGDAIEAAERLWWRRLPAVLTRPVPAFRALAEQEEADVQARQEPLLAVVLAAGVAGVLLTPTWGTLMDDNRIDGVVAAVLTFVGGAFYGAGFYFLLGLLVHLGARGMGSVTPFRISRQAVGLAAVPLALSLPVVLPTALAAFGGDWFRSGGSDEGAGGDVVRGIGLAAVAWSVVLVGVSLRVTHRLSWTGVAGAALLSGVVAGGLLVLPSLL